MTHLQAEWYNVPNIEILSKKNKERQFVIYAYILKLFSDDIEKAIGLFRDYSRMQDDRQFIDVQEENLADKTIQTEKQAKELNMNYFINYTINSRDLKNRQYGDLRRDVISTSNC